MSYEELYRTAYSLVLHKHGQMLYESVKETTVQLLKPIAEDIRLTHEEQFLREFNRVWKEVKECLKFHTRWTKMDNQEKVEKAAAGYGKWSNRKI